jgi:hypothetical protein
MYSIQADFAWQIIRKIAADNAQDIPAVSNTDWR